MNKRIRDMVLLVVVIMLVATFVMPKAASAHEEGIEARYKLTCKGGYAKAKVTGKDDWDKLLPHKNVYAEPRSWTWGNDPVVVTFHGEIKFPGSDRYTVIEYTMVFSKPTCEGDKVVEDEVEWPDFYVCQLKGVTNFSGLTYWGNIVTSKGELFLDKEEFPIKSAVSIERNGKKIGTAIVEEKDGKYNCVVPKVVEQQTDEVCLEDSQFSVSAVNKQEIKIRLWCDPELWAWDSTGELVEHRVLLPMKGAKVTVFHIKFSRPVSRVLIKSKHQTWSWPFAKKK